MAALLWLWGAGIVHSQAPHCRVCLSQVYGAGGRQGAPYRNDYIELFNPTASQQVLTGMQLEFAGASGTSWQGMALDSLVLPPYSYALVALGGGESGADLPPADLYGTAQINAGEGKMRLVDGDRIVVDLLGFGGADQAEGEAAAKVANGAALWRRQNGCQDTDNNRVDFEVRPPAPRTSQTAATSCSADTATPWPTDTATPWPTDTATPWPTDTATPWPTDTATPWPTDTLWPTDTSWPTETLWPTETATAWPTDTATPWPTETMRPTNTALPLPTNTLPVAPTSSNTPWIPTPTPPPATETCTPLPPPTPTWTVHTPTPTATEWGITPNPLTTPTSGPELTASPLPLPTETSTPLPPPTPTWALHTPTATATIYLLPTPTPLLTLHPTPTLLDSAPSETPTPLPPPTATGPATLTPTVTATATASPTPSDTPTATPPTTETRTPTPTAGPMETRTPTLSPTATDTRTPKPTRTPTETRLPTRTKVPTETREATATRTSTPSPTSSHTATATPTGTFTATPTPTLPANWQPGGAPSPLQIEEVGFAGSDSEYIVLANLSDEPLNLDGWLLGDAQAPGIGEGIYALPRVMLAPGSLYIVARKADAFYARFGRWPDAACEGSSAPPSILERRAHWSSGRLALNDSGDEVVLLGPDLTLADAVAYGDGDYAALRLEGLLDPIGNYTLQRVPGSSLATAADVRQRFLLAPARPFEQRGLPVPSLSPSHGLENGFVALWGTLGAQSNFTRGFSAPPHYVLAAAAAQGLHFVALADDGVIASPVQIPAGLTLLPAWRWRGGAEGAAVIYDGQPAASLTLNALSAYLAGSGAPLQWQGKGQPHLRFLAAVASDSLKSEDLADLFSQWRSFGAPLLAAGNAQPDLPGAAAVAPRFTGLAAAGQNAASIREALAAGRGWVTSDRNLWLTLKAQTEGGDSFWMGSWLPAANKVTLSITYGDGDSEAAALAIWQNGIPVEQLLLPPGDGTWRIDLPAMPGSLLAAVATQADGDFAVTAPLQVVQPPAAIVLINEVAPAPRQDLNQDGESDSQDEFIELWNPGSEPVALAGWQLLDLQSESEGGHRYTFGANRLILGGQRLLLWRAETHLSLDNGGDRLRLLDAAGAVRDEITWDGTLREGCATARVPDGSGWLAANAATPGGPNREAACKKAGAQGGQDRPPASNPLGDLPPIPTLDPTHGQAGGAPGSVAQSKLAGLEAQVEMDAIVTAPPGLFNGMMYIADPAGDGATAGIGVAVYLRQGEFPALAEGDSVHLRGEWESYRGEMELALDGPEDVWKLGAGAPLRPLPLPAREVCESVEGRLVTMRGVVAGWQGDSIYLSDPADPAAAPVRVTVRSSLGWKRPYVNRGEMWQVTGVVSQFARKSPWNDGYRVLMRYPHDMVCISTTP